MPQGKRFFNSSFANDSLTSNSNSYRKRYPKPSKVNLRFELAREAPVGDNPELVRLLYYRNLFKRSNASPQQMKALEGLIEILENKSANEEARLNEDNAERQATKSLGKYDLLFNALDPTGECAEPSSDGEAVEQELEKSFNELNISTESSPEKHVAADTASAIVMPQTNAYKKLRLPRHLERLIADTQLEDESQDDDSQTNKLSESNFINYRHPSKSLGHYLRRMLPVSELDSPDSTIQKSTIDDEFNVLTSKMENYHITPLHEKKIAECICNRKVHKTRCMSCSEVMDGRAFRRCNCHPKIVFTEDHFFCTKCCADIHELKEIDDA